MIEELRDYLIRHGLAEDLADDLHDAYYGEETAGALDIAETWATDQHDYRSEIAEMILGWRRESGEALEHIPEHIVDFAVATPTPGGGGWFVDATTLDGQRLRYGATPYAIKDRGEAEKYAAVLRNNLIDEGYFTPITRHLAANTPSGPAPPPGETTTSATEPNEP